jgi:hypothetical protein
VPDEVAARVAEAAAKRGVASEELLGQVVAGSFTSCRDLSFIAIGRSGRSETAERHKETDGDRVQVISQAVSPGYATRSFIAMT